MSPNLEWHGDEIIEELKREAEQVTGRVSLQDLFTVDFMREHTKHGTLDDMVTASKLLNEDCSTEDLAAALESQEWNQFVAENSDFSSWQEMITAAGESRLEGLLEE